MSGITISNKVGDLENEIPLKEIVKQPPIIVLEYHVYLKRWFILLLYCFSLISGICQNTLYVVIADVLVKYYGISYTLAQWTTLITAVSSLLCTFPSMYLVSKLGLRLSLTIGLAGNCVAAWIKMGSIHPSRFWILLLGQALGSVFRALVSPLPSKIAAVWFGKNEVSTACSIAVSSITFGIVVSNLLPPLFVKRGSTEVVETGLFNLGLTVAIFSTVMLVLVILFFSDSPPTPPSQAQEKKDKESMTMKIFANSIKSVLSNRSYVILLLLFGICFGMDFSLPVVLNQIVVSIHPSAADQIGFLGATSTLSGFVGSLVLGAILDRFKCYRFTTITIYVLHVLCIIAFLSTLHISLYLIYFTYALEGFMSMGIMATSFQLAVELTYPAAESTTGQLLLSSMQVIGIGLTYLYEYLFNNVTELVKNLVLSLILVGSLSLFFCIKFDLRRQMAENRKLNS